LAGTEPVAKMNLSPVTASPVSIIFILFESVKEAVPLITFTFLFFKRLATPPVSRSTIVFFRKGNIPMKNEDTVLVEGSVVKSGKEENG
jgi:hypothetical protein